MGIELTLSFSAGAGTLGILVRLDVFEAGRRRAEAAADLVFLALAMMASRWSQNKT